MFRIRNDFAVAFELPLVPSVRTQNLVPDAENMGAASWTLTGDATRTGAQADPLGSSAGYLLSDPSGDGDALFCGVACGNGTQWVAAFFRAGTATATRIAIFDNTAGVFRHRVNLQWSGGVPTLSTVEGAGTLFLPDYVGKSWYRIRFTATGVLSGNVNRLYIYPSIGSTGNVSAFGAQVLDPLDAAQLSRGPEHYLMTQGGARSNVPPVEIADRLIYHLRNGGTCSVYTNDAAASQYATCGLRPGTTPQLQLTDRRAMEFTLSLELVNLAGSPTRMMAHYAEQ